MKSCVGGIKLDLRSVRKAKAHNPRRQQNAAESERGKKRREDEDEPERKRKDKSEESHNKALTQSSVEIGRARHSDSGYFFLLLFACRVFGLRSRTREETRNPKILSWIVFRQPVHLIHFCSPFRNAVRAVRPQMKSRQKAEPETKRQTFRIHTIKFVFISPDSSRLLLSSCFTPF